MAFRQRTFERKKGRPPCECSCAEMAHWSRDGSCVVEACGCKQYRPRKAKNKYGAARAEVKGQHFDSKFEGKVATDLEYRKQCGENFTIRRQVDFPLVVNGKKICTYRADFVLDHADGTKEVVEAKGFRTPAFKIKWELAQALFPGVKFTEETERRGWRPW